VIPAGVEVFGSWMSYRDGTPLWTHGQYMVTARCKSRCHYLRELISRQYLDDILDPAWLWDRLEEKIARAFLRAHPCGFCEMCGEQPADTELNWTVDGGPSLKVCRACIPRFA
jgi:hypothetical protein